MIKTVGERAVERLLAAVVAAAGDELPGDLRVERTGDGVAIVGPAVRVRALTDGRISGIVQNVARRL